MTVITGLRAADIVRMSISATVELAEPLLVTADDHALIATGLYHLSIGGEEMRVSAVSEDGLTVVVERTVTVYDPPFR